jgi:hypothetical protein
MIRANRHIITKLPEPGEKWTNSSRVDEHPTIDELSNGPIRSFVHKGIIKKAGWYHLDGDKVRLYEITQPAYEVAHNRDDGDRGPIPGCAHTGLRNIAEDEYTCTVDGCDNTVTREQVEWN